MEYSLETKCIHGEGHRQKDALCAISYPIYQTASFSHLTPGHNLSGFDYTRESNPTRSYLEEVMTSIETGAADSLAFSTGMAAIHVCFEHFQKGDHIICTDDLYGGVVRLIALICRKNGLMIDYADTTDPQALKRAMRENTKAVYLETPSNPMMHVSDIRACAEIAHGNGALLIVDNTFLTSYLQNPLALGADIVVHSGTKYLNGHNDTACGFLCTKDAGLAKEFRLLAKTTGGVLAPFDAWLVMRGLKTLPLRMDRHVQNAQILAEWLLRQPFVTAVYYAGLPDHPGYAVNASQARGAGAMISFAVDSRETALRILRQVKLITFAESLGGAETLLTYPIIQTHADVPEEVRKSLGISDCLLRLSVGLESPGDIIRDLEQASERREGEE